MKDIDTRLKIRALELRQKHPNIDLALIESFLVEGALVVIERVAQRVRVEREELTKQHENSR